MKLFGYRDVQMFFIPMLGAAVSGVESNPSSVRKAIVSLLGPLPGIIIGIISAPEGATMEYTDQFAQQIEAFYAQIPEVRTYFMVVAPGLARPNPVNFALSFVSLKPWSERKR